MINSDNLAEQIREIVTRNQRIAAIEQEWEVLHSSRADEVVEHFLDALNKYPANVLRLPIATVLLEVTSDGCISTRMMRKALKQIENILRRAVGDAGVVIRCGKHKFAFMLTGIDDVTAAKVCQRIKVAMHHHCYYKLKLKERLHIEFTISRHEPGNSIDFADLVFSNEQSIRIARTLADGAIVTLPEVKERFQRHDRHVFHVGEINPTDIFELTFLA